MKHKWIGALLALPLSASGCNIPLEPEGVKLKAEGDGVLTGDERESAKSLLSSAEKVTEFSPEWQSLVNDADVFLVGEFEAAGLRQHRFSDDLHIYMAGSKEEMESRQVRPRTDFVPAAFYQSSNSTIYMLKDTFMPSVYFSALFHEAGHALRSPAYESPSLSYETYASLRAYSFDRQIGSLVADGVIWHSECLPFDEYHNDEFIKYYEIGYLGFLEQGNRSGGNLELAVDKILRAPQLYLEAIAADAGSRYANVCEANFYELEKLLKQPGFIAGLRRHMSMQEAQEYTDYLLLKARDVMMQGLKREGVATEQDATASFTADAEHFLAAHGSNPFFRASIASPLTGIYWNSAVSFADLDLQKAYGFAEKIILLNRDYPCAYEPFECPALVAEPRIEHTRAYEQALAWGMRLARNDALSYPLLMSLPEEYIAKFHAKGDYHYEENHPNIAVVTPYITFMAADTEVMLAHLAYLDGDSDGNRLHSCNAVDWFKRTLEAGCRRIPDADVRAECEEHISDNIEEQAEALIERYRVLGCD